MTFVVVLAAKLYSLRDCSLPSSSVHGVFQARILEWVAMSSDKVTFLPRSKRLLISWLQSPPAMILEPKKIVCHCFYLFPIYLPWSDRTGCHDLSFWNVLSQLLHASPSPSSRGSSVPLVSAPRLISSAYLRLLIFLLAILNPACDSSNLTFHIMYSACKLNKQCNRICLVCQFFNFRYSSGRKVLIVVLMFAFPQWCWRHLNMLTYYSFAVSACLVYRIIFYSNTIKAFPLKNI